MPCYPALALLLGSAMAAGDRWLRRSTFVLSGIFASAAAAAIAILILVRNAPTPGDIAGALSSHPQAYTLSLGHIEDLTLTSFAYLRLPLFVAACAFVIGAVGTAIAKQKRAVALVTLAMIIFFHAARLALVVFDPFMSSRPLADALLKSPPGTLIVNHHYYEFSSIFFYTNRTALLLNGRFNNLVYGSYAPNSPPVFIDDSTFEVLWDRSDRYYFTADIPGVKRIETLLKPNTLNLISASGGKMLLTNHPLPGPPGSVSDGLRK